MGYMYILNNNLRNCAEYRLILSRRGRRPSGLSIRRYSARLSRIHVIVLLFNTLITKHRFIAEKLEAIFICRKKETARGLA